MTRYIGHRLVHLNMQFAEPLDVHKTPNKNRKGGIILYYQIIKKLKEKQQHPWYPGTVFITNGSRTT